MEYPGLVTKSCYIQVKQMSSICETLSIYKSKIRTLTADKSDDGRDHKKCDLVTAAEYLGIQCNEACFCDLQALNDSLAKVIKKTFEKTSGLGDDHFIQLLYKNRYIIDCDRRCFPT